MGGEENVRQINYLHLPRGGRYWRNHVRPTENDRFALLIVLPENNCHQPIFIIDDNDNDDKDLRYRQHFTIVLSKFLPCREGEGKYIKSIGAENQCHTYDKTLSMTAATENC